MTAPSPPPTLPAVVARLLAACADEEGPQAELTRAVEGDPGIAGRLLRLANSAYYGLPRQVATVDRAVVLLGRATVQAVALAATVLQAWGGRAVPPEAEGLWVHAYLCGLGCRHLGQRLPASAWRSPADALFLTGLLHDIGQLLFLAREPEAYVEALGSGTDGALRAWEAERFGADHAEVGGETLEAWQLPPRLAEVVRRHHAGGLRAELRADWEVLRAVDDLLAGGAPEVAAPALPEGLRDDLGRYLEGAREQARAFYEAVA